LFLVCGSNYHKNLSIFLAMALSIEDYIRKNLGFAGRFISEFGETGVTIAMKDIKQ